MQRMENEELMTYSGGGLISVIANIFVSIISLTKAILSLRNLRG